MQSSTPSQTNDPGIHLSTGVVNAVPRGQTNSPSLHGEVSVLRIRVVETGVKDFAHLKFWIKRRPVFKTCNRCIYSHTYTYKYMYMYMYMYNVYVERWIVTYIHTYIHTCGRRGS